MLLQETEDMVREALVRIVRQAFNPPTTRHKRKGFAGSPCDVTCQACAVAQAKKALEQMEAEIRIRQNHGHKWPINERGELLTTEEI